MTDLAMDDDKMRCKGVSLGHEQARLAEPRTAAEGGDADLLAGPVELVDERGDEAAAGRAHCPTSR